MDLKEIGLVDPDKHWYYQHKAEFIFKKVVKFLNKPKTLIDVGAGSGFFAKYFLNKLAELKVYCVDPYYTNEEVGEFNSINFVREAPAIQSNLLIFIDVLEHVDNDKNLIEKYR